VATPIRLPGDVVFKINNAGNPLLQELMESGEVGQLTAPAGDQSWIGERCGDLLRLRGERLVDLVPQPPSVVGREGTPPRYDLAVGPERGEVGMRRRNKMEVVREQRPLEDVDGEVEDEFNEAVSQRAATFLVFKERRAPNAARDAVASNGLGRIEDMFTRSCV